MAVPETPGGVTIKANVAAGKWTTICRASGIGSSSLSGPNGSFLFSNTFVVNRRTHIVAAYSGRVPADMDTRLVALDRTGKIIPASGASSVSNNSGYIGEFSVASPQNSIREWQVQTRPFKQWIEIRGISLHAGKKTNVTTATSDDQPNP